MKKWLTALQGLTALATLLLALLLCWQCIDLYREGNSPGNLDENGLHLTDVYTVEKVAARLQPLAPVFGGYVLLVIAALALRSASAPAKVRLTIPADNRLRLMKARTAELPQAAQKEERLRLWVRAAAGAVTAVCAAGSLVYLLNRAHFTSWELEGVMGQMLLHVGPWVLIAFAAWMAASLVCARSMERELAALKDAPRCAVKQAEMPRALPVHVLRGILYAIAAVFIVLGVMNGGLYDVLVKAINICTECIGLG